ncbi:uncharacterized protein LOC123384673 [Felis catus]|uniref:uncharacterized protein LOC123384673 n=1 Tax=Felis catus TaxID=9685 RepID=UPI001D19CEDC|nr:uncharacterized protein LOC123384673 [Felis catus]
MPARRGHRKPAGPWRGGGAFSGGFSCPSPAPPKAIKLSRSICLTSFFRPRVRATPLPPVSSSALSHRRPAGQPPGSELTGPAITEPPRSGGVGPKRPGPSCKDSAGPSGWRSSENAGPGQCLRVTTERGRGPEAPARVPSPALRLPSPRPWVCRSGLPASEDAGPTCRHEGADPHSTRPGLWPQPPRQLRASERSSCKRHGQETLEGAQRWRLPRGQGADWATAHPSTNHNGNPRKMQTKTSAEDAVKCAELLGFPGGSAQEAGPGLGSARPRERL